MKYLRAIGGRFSIDHFELLDSKGVSYFVTPRNRKKNLKMTQANFTIVEGEIYFELLNHFEDVLDYRDKRTTLHFDEPELKEYKFFFNRDFTGVAQLYDITRKCSECYNYFIDDIDPYHLEAEPKLPKNAIWGDNNSFNRILITSISNFEKLEADWNMRCRPLYIGKSRVESKQYVGLDIDIAKHPLNFENSGFGQIHKNCSTCGSIYYFGNPLELFPNFIQSEEYHICMTQEKFIPYGRPIIVSRKFVSYMVKNKMTTWGPYTLIPLKPILPELTA